MRHDLDPERLPNQRLRDHADRYAGRFKAQRFIHRAELDAQPGAEVVLDGFEPRELAPGFLAIPTPGHTAGHCVLLYQGRFLFTGDHLWWDRDDQRLVTTVKNLLELGQATRELQKKLVRERRRHAELERQYDLRGMVWRDAATERVLALACQVARADLPRLSRSRTQRSCCCLRTAPACDIRTRSSNVMSA